MRPRTRPAGTGSHNLWGCSPEKNSASRYYITHGRARGGGAPFQHDLETRNLENIFGRWRFLDGIVIINQNLFSIDLWGGACKSASRTGVCLSLRRGNHLKLLRSACVKGELKNDLRRTKSHFAFIQQAMHLHKIRDRGSRWRSALSMHLSD